MIVDKCQKSFRLLVNSDLLPIALNCVLRVKFVALTGIVSHQEDSNL